jgi:hypothetical protein
MWRSEYLFRGRGRGKDGRPGACVCRVDVYILTSSEESGSLPPFPPPLPMAVSCPCGCVGVWVSLVYMVVVVGIADFPWRGAILCFYGLMMCVCVRVCDAATSRSSNCPCHQQHDRKTEKIAVCVLCVL